MHNNMTDTNDIVNKVFYAIHQLSYKPQNIAQIIPK